MQPRCLWEAAVKPRGACSHLSCNPWSVITQMRRLNMKNALIITLKSRLCQCSCHYWQCRAAGLLHSFHQTSCMSAGDTWLLWAKRSSCLLTDSSRSDNLFWRVWKGGFCRPAEHQHGDFTAVVSISAELQFPSSLIWMWMTLYYQ